MNESGVVVGTLLVPRATCGLRAKGIVWHEGHSALLQTACVNPDAIMLAEDASWTMPVINDLGQIMVRVSAPNGSSVYRFDPVPEPAGLVALGVGAVALLRRKKRSGLARR